MSGEQAIKTAFWGGSLYLFSLASYPTALPAADAGDAASPAAEAETEQEAVTLPEMTVTGTPGPSKSYNVYSTTTATKTDTPIFDTPVSIQVVPREVLDDQKPLQFRHALENVSGVRPQPSIGFFNGFIIRGFRTFDTHRNGLRADYTDFDTANMESMEVLKGPAAVLYGRMDPGGLINVTTKQPLATPYYALEGTAGSYDFYRMQWDATGPINKDSSLLYRFVGAYQNSDSFRDFLSTDRYQINPSITWRPSEATELTVDIEGFNQYYQNDFGVPVIGRRPTPVPISRSLQDPNDPIDNISNVYLGFNFSHRFNENWTLRNQFLGRFYHVESNDLVPAPSFDASALQPDNRTLDRNILFQEFDQEDYGTNLDLVGKLDLWGTDHEVLVGVDYYRWDWTYQIAGDFENPDPALALDIFNPSYGIDPALFDLDRLLGLQPYGPSAAEQRWYGVYFQDHVTLWHKLHIVGGGRYDWVTSGRGFGTVPFSFDDIDVPERDTEEFSPRVGILYQPWDWFAVYGNWVQSFAGNAASPFGSILPPETGEQYEAGIKTEFFNGGLTTTLAYYYLTKENIPTADLSTPDPSDSVAIGEARSQGIELDISGRITERLSVIGNYAFTDTRVLKDNFGLEGKRLENVPEHSGSLWLKFDFEGMAALEGLSLGAGVFAAGARHGDADNSFILPGYARLDAYAAYGWKLGSSRVTAQLNVRNLLDKVYFESSEPFSNSNPRLSIFPGDPLTFLGSIRVEF